MDFIEVEAPLSLETISLIRAGDWVLITGELLTARDAAHKILSEMIDQGKKLPFSLAGETIYYLGPTPPRPGRVIGSAGPTTSSRMDPYMLSFLKAGARGFIGKGPRSLSIREMLVEFKGVYFATLGGAGALLSRFIKEAKVIAFPNLGPEAVFRLRVVEFPALVIYDSFGGDLFEMKRKKEQGV
jgi:fumarate hydratase subunit beta